MAVYRTVQVNFWQDDFVLDLTPEERYFYVYLLTCSKTTQCGIFPFPKRLAEMETASFRKKESSVSTGETEEFLARCEEWEKNAPSEEELQRFLAERGWRP
ncbi:hypothetical protein L4A40_26415 [Bacillus cereus]|uniref:hypothetical protein n=1 Tax=Bacillus cereus TaxID=1396 RepID=UPI001F103C2E|nr:hypothetical protein [Bacillus cereus]MCH5476639.1 hypothetical protein [Bacillus cereus]